MARVHAARHNQGKVGEGAERLFGQRRQAESGRPGSAFVWLQTSQAAFRSERRISGKQNPNASRWGRTPFLRKTSRRPLQDLPRRARQGGDAADCRCRGCDDHGLNGLGAGPGDRSRRPPPRLSPPVSHQAPPRGARRTCINCVAGHLKRRAAAPLPRASAHWQAVSRRSVRTDHATRPTPNAGAQEFA